MYEVCVWRRVRTIVVGCLQDGEEVVGLAVLREDADASEGALLAGDMERGVSSEVPDVQVASGFQEVLSDFGLISDHCQVKGSLQAKQRRETCELHGRRCSSVWTHKPCSCLWISAQLKTHPTKSVHYAS